ncbi:MAG: hypothetical protein RLZ28_1032 [Actinomycetota bacterium]
MRPTRWLTLIAVAAVTGFAALTATDFLVKKGQEIFVAPVSLIITLPGIAILLVVIAWPVVRYRRDLALAKKAETVKPVKRVNPFYAVRVLLLAKASAITAAAILGWQVGFLIFLYSRPIVVTDASTKTFATALGSIFLLVIALAIERFCRLPNDTDSAGSFKTSAKTATSAEPEALA